MRNVTTEQLTLHHQPVVLNFALERSQNWQKIHVGQFQQIWYINVFDMDFETLEVPTGELCLSENSASPNKRSGIG